MTDSNEDWLDKNRRKPQFSDDIKGGRLGRSMSDFMSVFTAKEAELKEKYGAKFDKESVRFVLNVAEAAVVAEWLESLKPEILELQRKTDCRASVVPDQPYYGAIGGGVTYSFIPTGLGDIITVKEHTTGKELNISEALDWHFFG